MKRPTTQMSMTMGGSSRPVTSLDSYIETEVRAMTPSQLANAMAKSSTMKSPKSHAMGATSPAMGSTSPANALHQSQKNQALGDLVQIDLQI